MNKKEFWNLMERFAGMDEASHTLSAPKEYVPAKEPGEEDYVGPRFEYYRWLQANAPEEMESLKRYNLMKKGVPLKDLDPGHPGHMSNQPDPKMQYNDETGEWENPNMASRMWSNFKDKFKK